MAQSKHAKGGESQAPWRLEGWKDCWKDGWKSQAGNGKNMKTWGLKDDFTWINMGSMLNLGGCNNSVTFKKRSWFPLLPWTTSVAGAWLYLGPQFEKLNMKDDFRVSAFSPVVLWYLNHLVIIPFGLQTWPGMHSVVQCWVSDRWRGWGWATNCDISHQRYWALWMIYTVPVPKPINGNRCHRGEP
jgi:hypothetical protein